MVVSLTSVNFQLFMQGSLCAQLCARSHEIDEGFPSSGN